MKLNDNATHIFNGPSTKWQSNSNSHDLVFGSWENNAFLIDGKNGNSHIPHSNWVAAAASSSPF